MVVRVPTDGLVGLLDLRAPVGQLGALEDGLRRRVELAHPPEDDDLVLRDAVGRGAAVVAAERGHARQRVLEVGDLLDAGIILAIIVFCALLGFVQEYRAERALDALKKMLTPTITALRGGREEEIPSKELVPGDIILLEAGDKIPADGRLVEIHSLQCDEAPLTGESFPVEKDLKVLPEAVPVGDLASDGAARTVADERLPLLREDRVRVTLRRRHLTRTHTKASAASVAGAARAAPARSTGDGRVAGRPPCVASALGLGNSYSEDGTPVDAKRTRSTYS